MKKIINTLKQDNMLYSLNYAYIHFILEVVCFYFLSRLSNSLIVWLIPFLYDGFAFVPQSLIGYIKDKYNKFEPGYIGASLLFIGILLFSFTNINSFIILFIICIANSMLHIEGAYHTIKVSNGKLSHSSIFVGFGAFGVITGRLISKTNVPPWFLLFIIITMIPFLILGNRNTKGSTKNYNYVNKSRNQFTVIILATFVVMVRAYMGYRIPTAWNTTTLDTILLFFSMGFGKILGGILSDSFGIKKIALLSTIISIPFIIFGNNNMIISLFGILLFSMTMSITLAIIVSTLKENICLAFGFTTIGLFLGTIPIFFISIENSIQNTILLVIMSIMSCIILNYIIKGDKYD